MKTNIRNIANNFYKKVNVKHVLKEAIMNAIHAGATNIDVFFKFSYKSDILKGQKNIDNLLAITINDNGEGLTQKNIDAFFELATENKKEKFGGKGIGRIAFLKLANKINVESISKEQ